MDSFSRDPLAPAIEDGVAEPSKRGRKRDSLFLSASIRLGDERETRDVRVRNLSEGGMMAELDRVVPVGTPVAADLRGVGTIAGTVAWCAERRIGIAFDQPVDPRKARKPVGNGARTPYYAKPAI